MKAVVKKAAKQQATKPQAEKASSLGALVDKLYALNTARAELTQKEKDLKAQIAQLEGVILEKFSKNDLSGAAGKVAKLSVTTKVSANVEDWDLLYTYIAKEDAWDLLQRRVSSTAYAARLEEGIEVPGTTKFSRLVISTKKK